MHKRSVPWPGPDEKEVIDAMLADGDSHHWSKCYELVERLIQYWASDLAVETKEDITQNAMIKVTLYLPTFQQASKLSTWVTKIVRTCIADEFRKNQQTHNYQLISLNQPLENDKESTNLPAPLTTEEEFLMEEDMRIITEAILQHLSKRGKQERNNEIFELFLDGHNQQKIALELGIPAPVVGYVIRSIQRYAREFRQHQPPLPPSPR